MRPAIPNEQWAPSNRRGIPDGQWPPPRGGSSGNLRDAGGIRRQAAWSFHSEQASRSQPSWSERDEPVRGSSGGSYGDVMKRVMEAVIPKSDPVQRLLPVTSDDFPPAAGNRKILREKVPERDDPVEQVIAAGGCDEQEMVSKIRGELEKMKREDWVGYEILLKAVKAINDPASGSMRNSLLANASPAVRSLSTNKLFV
ncbi:hypothetical protein GCK32_005345 [Trichostrongylus colubriformis]|uniref:Uncharacterized protein n=1 Tax=Trichostrongylus colubriformis TaxID=6319 RepID=A0AAN8IS78_TRICO